MSVQRTACLAAIRGGLLFGCSPTQQSFRTRRSSIREPSDHHCAGPEPRRCQGSAPHFEFVRAGKPVQQHVGRLPGRASGAPPPGLRLPRTAARASSRRSAARSPWTPHEIEQPPQFAAHANPIFWPFAIVVAVREAAEAVQGRAAAQQEPDTRGARGRDPSKPAAGRSTKSRERRQDQERRRGRSDAARTRATPGWRRPSANSAPASGCDDARPPAAAALDCRRTRGASQSRPARLATARWRAAPRPFRAAARRWSRDRTATPRRSLGLRDGGKKTREVFDDDADGRSDRTLYYEPGGEARSARIEQDTTPTGQRIPGAPRERQALAAPRGYESRRPGRLVDLLRRTRPDHPPGAGSRRRRLTRPAPNSSKTARSRAARRPRRRRQPDRTTRFDAQGNQTELEEDKDGDGQIDVKSYTRRTTREARDSGRVAEGATP